MIILSIIMGILLILTFFEIRRIRKHSIKMKKHEQTHEHESEDKSENKKDLKSLRKRKQKKSHGSPFLVILGIVFFGLMIYLGYFIAKSVSNKDLREKKLNIKPLAQSTQTSKSKNSSDGTSDGSSSESSVANKNEDKLENQEFEETVSYKFFSKYKNIFGEFISENGSGFLKKKNQIEVVTSENIFRVTLKNNNVYKVYLTVPFEKEVYSKNLINFDRTKSLIKKFNAYKDLINPVDNSIELLNEKVKKGLMDPKSFVHVKTELLEEKREYLIMKVIYKEGTLANKSIERSIKAKVYSDGKITLMN